MLVPGTGFSHPENSLEICLHCCVYQRFPLLCWWAASHGMVIPSFNHSPTEKHLDVSSFLSLWTKLLRTCVSICVNVNFYFPGINGVQFLDHTVLLLFSSSVVSGSFVTPQTVACQAPLWLGFPGQEHWSSLPFLSPAHLPSPGIKPTAPALAGRFFASELPGKPGPYGVICSGFRETERLISRVAIFSIATSSVWMAQLLHSLVNTWCHIFILATLIGI